MEQGSRRPSIQMAHVSAGRMASPPAPPAGVNMRAWFAGLALGNPELMKDVPAADRATEALRLADELLAALVSKVPTAESLAPPTEAEMKVWDNTIATQTHVTVAPPRSQQQSRIPTEPGIPTPQILDKSTTTRDTMNDATTQPTVVPRHRWSAGLPKSNRPPAQVKPTTPGIGAYCIIDNE